MLKRWAAWPQGVRWRAAGIAAVVVALAMEPDTPSVPPGNDAHPAAPGRGSGDRVSAGAVTNVPPRPEQALRVQRVQAGVQHRDPRAGILTAGTLPGGLAPDAERQAARRTAVSALPPGGHLAEGVQRPQIALQVALGLDDDSLDRQVHPSEGGLLGLRHQQILLQPAGRLASLIGSHHSTC